MGLTCCRWFTLCDLVGGLDLFILGADSELGVLSDF